MVLAGHVPLPAFKAAVGVAAGLAVAFVCVKCGFVG